METAQNNTDLEAELDRRRALRATGGPFAVATRTRRGNYRRLPDTRFDDFDRATSYGQKYHQSRFRVVLHPDHERAS